MGDTVKIRQLRPGQRPGMSSAPETKVLDGLDRVVEEVKLALMTTGLTLQSDKGSGQDPYNTRTGAKTRDAWSNHNRRR
jgi:hypothetical protein